jgi:hypothetical protein
LRGRSGASPVKRGYDSWRQVAGYFDGDGTVMLTARTFTIYFSIEWADTSRAQLKQIKSFLRANAVYCQPKLITKHGKYVSYGLHVAFQDSILRLAKSLVRFSFKKKEELRGVIDYLENGITGNELIEIFNMAVRSGTRVGIIREVSLPYTRSEGLRLARRLGARRSGLSRRVLTEAQVAEIKRRRLESHEPIRKLAREYGVSTNVILRAIHSY